MFFKKLLAQSGDHKTYLGNFTCLQTHFDCPKPSGECYITPWSVQSSSIDKQSLCQSQLIVNYFAKYKIVAFFLKFQKKFWHSKTLVGQRPMKSILSICSSVRPSVRPSVHPSIHSSITKVSQDWIISFSWYCTWW